jgi:hypothetical protein
MKKRDDLFDRRVVEMNIREGIVTEEEYARFLKSVPDRKNDAEWIPVEEVAPLSYLRAALGIDKSAAKEEETETKAQKKSRK